eukprot:TRINITY_DN5657_c0_g1_i1.p1 TRINITY_DN5657_c0_g1~~TRINITY_DN5657_c0_g1_i1.p1  ORF type:complete len:292 (-),score=68.60 TRINITY_DN5657_c0_g1_i1:87-926(-)
MAAIPRAFKFASIQLAVGSDKAVNLQRARESVLSASLAGAKMVMLPECFNSPYGNQYFASYAEPISGPTVAMLKEVAKEANVYLIGGSIPEVDGDKLYNTSVSFSPQGDLLGIHRKVHLFDIDIPGQMTFKESETLTAGESLTVLSTEYGSVGVGICYDIRFAEMAAIYGARGCFLLCFPAAFNMTTGPAHWKLLQRGRAIDNQVFVATASPARDMEATYNAYGHSMVVDPWGEVLVEADETAKIVYATIDLDRQDQVRNQIPVLSQKRLSVYSVPAEK